MAVFIPAEEKGKLHSQSEQFEERVTELTALARKAGELTETSVALAQVCIASVFSLILSNQLFEFHRIYNQQVNVLVVMAMQGPLQI